MFGNHQSFVFPFEQSSTAREPDPKAGQAMALRGEAFLDLDFSLVPFLFIKKKK